MLAKTLSLQNKGLFRG